ncbi:SOS response-associated peptidase family protein [Hanstruepera ponticola]|uniref:SOS response-associated peptidase family protein n=1 Tax=Hanstruepera ponticola TaxID=2042995 RepID=UPI0017857BED|nr:SOS response-associated peptidase family protein [Hanstruepera ponticola]
MFYKLSNTASKERIEKEFNAKFKYPNLYESNPLINGFKEESIYIITDEMPHQIVPGIWGLLPKDFEDDWIIFQNVNNTLNFDEDMLQNDDTLNNQFCSKRCLIIITGFFTSYIKNGTIYPYYVYTKLNNPISVAGLYNKLNDGFKTCTILVSEANNFIRNIHNINVKMPLIIPKEARENWLKNESNMDIESFAKASNEIDLHAHPIAKEFFKNDIVFESMLDPVRYKDLP